MHPLADASSSASWGELLRLAARLLAEAGIESPAREARLIAGDVMDAGSADVIAREDTQPEPGQASAFSSRLAQRLSGMPLSRIRGWREFHGRRFTVTGDVLDPRPETELLVEQGLRRLPPSGRVLDLGVGSGAILVTLLAEREDTTGVGIDISEAALRIAQGNAFAHGVDDRARLLQGGWRAGEGAFDLVVSNPPYITEAEFAELSRDVREHDPRIALVGGADGLDPYREIAPLAFARLKPGGWLGVEHGAKQSIEVQVILRDSGFDAVEAFDDLAGLPRAVFGRRP